MLRYVERLGSHDAGLRLLARRRVEVYDAAESAKAWDETLAFLRAQL